MGDLAWVIHGREGAVVIRAVPSYNEVRIVDMAGRIVAVLSEKQIDQLIGDLYKATTAVWAVGDY